MGISIISMYGQSTSATPDIPASSMVVYPIAGAIRNVALFGNSVIGSNQNLPVQGILAVMCINNT